MRPNKNKNVQQDNTPSFIKTQRQFTQYIRDPDNSPKPTDIEERRMDMYRDLLFTNISGMLSDGFPVLKQILPEAKWTALCRDFFSRHQSHSPYFSEISQEFIQFLQSERSESKESENDLPFLVELAHYEWTELFVSIAEENVAKLETIENPTNRVLTVSNTAMAVAYTYPVHKISPDYLPSEAPDKPTYLAVYRTTDNQAGFLETTPMTHALLVTLTNNVELTTDDLLSQLANQLQHPNPNIVKEGGLTIVNDFIQRGIVILTE
jgi:hypothetical protein